MGNRKQNLPGKLTLKEHRDDVGQVVGERAGTAGTGTRRSAATPTAR